MTPTSWALLSAAFCALGVVLQQKGALEAPPATSAGFVGAILSKPVWLAGGACQLCGWLAQGLALRDGQLFLVQPIISLQVVFALPLGIWITHQQVGQREWLGALAVLGGLGIFLAVSDPAAGREDAPLGVWVAATGVVAAVTATLAVLGARRRPATKAALFGTAAGVLFGFQAATMKAFTQVVGDGIVALLSSWTTYALIVSSIVGFYLVQVSLQAGALAPSVAASNAANPVTSAALGRTVFLETPQRTPGGKVASLLSLAVLVVGLVWLARGEAAAGEQRQALPRPS